MWIVNSNLSTRLCWIVHDHYFEETIIETGEKEISFPLRIGGSSC